MHFYVVDAYVQTKAYERDLARIETTLTNLGINGTVARLNILKDLGELVHDAIRRGVNTIVAIGDDNTLSKMINVMARHEAVLGLIPLGEHNILANLLGIPLGEAACETIAKRITQDLDLGQANDIYFLSTLEASTPEVVLESNNGYRILPQATTSRVVIANLIPWNKKLAEITYSYQPNPQDGQLEAMISGPKTHQNGLGWFRPKNNKHWVFNPVVVSELSVFPFTNLKLASQPGSSITVWVDGKKILKTPINISLAQKKLKIIVGKERVF